MGGGHNSAHNNIYVLKRENVTTWVIQEHSGKPSWEVRSAQLHRMGTGSQTVLSH